MVISGSDIMGADVLVSEDRRRIGMVTDVVMNPDKYNIDAFVVSDGTTGKIVRFSDVREVKRSEIVIGSEQSLKYPDTVIEDSDGNQVGSMPVVTETGESKGSVSDILFDTDSGEVKHLAVTTPG